MSNPISVSFGGDVEVQELNPSEVPVDLDLYSFKKQKRFKFCFFKLSVY